VQMEQKYIEEFVLMSGYAPSHPDAEYNCKTDAYACSAFFTDVTFRNGYPHVYVVPFNTGAANVVTQVPVRTLPPSNPTAFAFTSINNIVTSDEDSLAVEYAVFGSAGWTLSSNSSNFVNAATGENSWSSRTASGQYYLTSVAAPIEFEVVLANPWLPRSVAGAELDQYLLDELLPAKPGSHPISSITDYIVKRARLGGYLARTHDPPPGNAVIWRGLSRLTDIELDIMIGVQLVGN